MHAHWVHTCASACVDYCQILTRLEMLVTLRTLQQACHDMRDDTLYRLLHFYVSSGPLPAPECQFPKIHNVCDVSSSCQPAPFSTTKHLYQQLYLFPGRVLPRTEVFAQDWFNGGQSWSQSGVLATGKVSGSPGSSFVFGVHGVSNMHWSCSIANNARSSGCS